MRLRTFAGLWIDDLASDSDAPRPRALALLAMLASAAGKGLSRDRVMAVLWPDSDSERARHVLSQTLYGLRRVLDADVVLATPELRLDTSRISSDIEEFRAAVRDKRWSDAAALYVGPFLEGFYLSDAPEFERWAETERVALAADGVRALEAVAIESSRADAADAPEHWRRLTLLDPYNARFAAAYMESLAARGDRATAMAHGKAYTDLLRGEFEAHPDPVVEQLMTRLRSGTPVTNVAIASAKATVSSSQSGSATSTGLQSVFASRRRLLIAASALVAASLTAFVAWRSARAREPRTPIMAVGRIRDLVAPESTSVSAVLSEMLSTSLARVGDLQVVANSRMLEITPAGADTSRSAIQDAARRAGASEMIEGELLPMASRQLRLEIRRVDLRRGVVRAGYRVSGDDRIAMFDSVTSLIASDLRVGAPRGSLAEVSTGSPIAYRLYEEGLRAFYQFDPAAAGRLFDAAVREDSTFAMAAYYAWRAALATGNPAQEQLSAMALRLAARATQRDRLLITTHVGGAQSDPHARAAAETLATNFPNDPEALRRAAEVIHDEAHAIRLLNRSIELDSIAGGVRGPTCRVCEAFQSLSGLYSSLDSLHAAERSLLRWTRQRPGDYAPWGTLSSIYIAMGRLDDATDAMRRYDALGGKRSFVDRDNLVRSIQAEDFDASLSLCSQVWRNDDPTSVMQFRWYCTIALRSTGRYREARALLEQGRMPGSRVVRGNLARDGFNSAILDVEMGRPLAAVRTFRDTYRPSRDSVGVAPGVQARRNTWAMGLAATAAVKGGDTAHARALMDSMEVTGQRSNYIRDQRLHHFIRGLLFAHAGKQSQAAAAYQAAMTSPTFGYTRINYELGKTLLVLGRPADGIHVVSAALRGGIEGSNLYVTRTELHELLAQLFDAAGIGDSATVHFRAVVRAWRNADPVLKPRHAAAAARLKR